MMYNRQTQWNFGLLPIWACKNHWYSSRRSHFARGACDDKGQMYMHVKAFEYMIQSNTLPCNVKFMIEGKKKWKCQSKTFVENNTENLKMMWF
jgi:hypothetical protein